MAVSAQRITVSTTAVALNAASPAGQTLLLKNTSANAADLGAAGVTAGTGFHLAAGGAGEGGHRPPDHLSPIPPAAAAPPPPPLRPTPSSPPPPTRRPRLH